MTLRNLRQHLLVHPRPHPVARPVRPALQARVVECQFEDWKGGRYKTISFFAKRARGLMCRWAIEHRARTPQALRAFDAEGYALQADASTDDRLVFRRRLSD